ncbi:MAG: YhgE/Pip domain-containing protein, partial [Bacillota bacterium]|nr:YhgE/Pip domain-containing protein [Bacillota bacterium]
TTLNEKSGNVQEGTDKLATGSKDLNKGMTKANRGVQSLVEGNKKLSTGNEQLSAGLEKLAEGATQLQVGTTQTLGGLKQLQKGIDTSATGTKKIQAGMAGLAEGLKTYAQAHPELAKDPYYQKILVTSEQLTGGAGQLAQGQAELSAGANQLVAGQTKFSDGMTTLNQNLAKASDSSKKLSQGQILSLNGSQKLQQGLQSLQVGSSKLGRGATDLQVGFIHYSKGVKEANDGGNELTKKLQKASNDAPNLNDGQLSNAFSKPIGLKQEKLGHINKYGTGFAPYFLALGLFVGALLMSIVIDFYTPSGEPKNGVAWFIGKFVIVASVGLIQALIVDAVLLKGLGLTVQSVPSFIGLSILISFTFISIVQFLVTSMGNPGRFIAVIFLILQLASSSGSYPVILSPHFFQAISQYLPMTFAIDALRYWIAGGNHTFMVEDIIKIGIYMIGFMLLTMLYLTLRFQLKMKKEAV